MPPKLTKTKFAQGKWWRKCNGCNRWLNLETAYRRRFKDPARSDRGSNSKLPMPLRQHICKSCNKKTRAMKVYGVTEEEYRLLLSSSCAICSSKELLHIDHCHESGKVRGRLCSKCNQAIGLMDEDTELMMAAIEYLVKHRELPR